MDNVIGEDSEEFFIIPQAPESGEHIFSNDKDWVELKKDDFGLVFDQKNIVNEEFDILKTKPYDSWVLDENGKQWIPPLPIPESTQTEPDENGNITYTTYYWNENIQSWNSEVITISTKPKTFSQEELDNMTRWEILNEKKSEDRDATS